MDMAKKAAFLLGYTVLKDKQEEIISTMLQGRDVFGVLPTGYGKVCVSHDILLGKEAGHSIVIVVSPLKALMEDQVS